MKSKRTVEIVRVGLLCAASGWIAVAQLTDNPAPASEISRGRRPPPVMEPLEAPGLDNLYLLGTNLFSGGAPEGEEAFSALAKLGVKTIITVDGARPDVEAAARHGMRYVHLPHGYDGISPELQLRLANAGQMLPGPIYVHCHHGRHRGPAAAAVICIATDGWTSQEAEAWLRTAGTSTNYGGLYEDVRTFRGPTANELARQSADFPQMVEVSGLVGAMVGIDESWEHLQAVRVAGYQVPQAHPDLEPAQEAVILWKHLREAQRLPESVRLGDDFVERLRAAEDHAKKAEALLRSFGKEPTPEIRAHLEETFAAIAESCRSCHDDFRNRSGGSRRESSSPE